MEVYFITSEYSKLLNVHSSIIIPCLLYLNHHTKASFTVVLIHALWLKCWYFVSLHNSVSTRTSRFHWKVGRAKNLMELLLQWVHSYEPSHLGSLQIGLLFRIWRSYRILDLYLEALTSGSHICMYIYIYIYLHRWSIDEKNRKTNQQN